MTSDSITFTRGEITYTLERADWLKLFNAAVRELNLREEDYDTDDVKTLAQDRYLRKMEQGGRVEQRGWG